MTHDERLRVPGWWWALGWFLALSFVIAVGAFLGPRWGLAALVIFFAAVSALLWGWGRATIRVDDQALVVDGARLEGRWIATAEAKDAAETRAWLRSRESADDWLMVRPWLSHSVRVEVDDPADPHAGWLVGTRRPEALAAAVNALAATRQEQHD